MLEMENDSSRTKADVPPVVSRSVEGSSSPRYSANADEVGRLLMAGLEEIREKGSVEPRVADIVKRAGLSNKAFYRHFRSKDELLLAILEQGMRERVRTFQARLSEAPSAAERVRVWVRTVLEQALNPAYAEVTRPMFVYTAQLTEQLGAELWSHVDHLRAPLERALDDGKRSGEFRNVDPSRDAVGIYWLAMGWMQGKVLERVTPSEEEAEHLVEFALRGILAKDTG